MILRSAILWSFPLSMVAASGDGGGSEDLDACESVRSIRATPASVCEEVFGEESDHEEDRRRREAILEGVDVTEHDVWITHSGDWSDPEPLHFANLALVGVETNEGCAPVAVVELDNESDDIACDSDLYLIEQDSSLGEDTHVLAIIDNVVIVEHEGKLMYLVVSDHSAPPFRMVWHAPFTIAKPRFIAPKRARPKSRSRRVKRR